MKNKRTIFFSKTLISIILMLVVLILIKSSTSFKNNFYKQVYDNNISYTYLKKLYKKYIGNTDILDNIIKTDAVFSEKLVYNDKEKYMDGVKLTVDDNYLVPLEESGIVVFIGDKEGYGNTIIVQRVDGIDEWYGNITNTNVKLYDYVKKGSVLGEANKNLYLVYKKDSNILNYEEYLK